MAVVEMVKYGQREELGFGPDKVRLVSDRWRRERVGDRPRAYDSQDVVERYQALSEQLSGSELRRLAEKDEVDMLVASLAETVELELYPYNLFEFEGRVGSLAEIEGDGGERIWVFRDVVDMLESRVTKFPDDDRSKAVLSGFVNSVPELLGLEVGETAVYFSPPAEEGGLEGEYGFVYFLTKREDGQTELSYFDSFSVKVDWEMGDYFDVLEQNGVWVRGAGYQDDYWATTDQVIMLDGQPVETVVKKVLGGDERFKNGVASWLANQRLRYEEVLDFVRDGSEEFVSGVVGGGVDDLRRVVEELQLDWLERKDPVVYNQIQVQLREFGYAELLVACGYLEFGGGFADPLQRIMRGVWFGDDELYVWKCECGTRNDINVPMGIYKERCDGCGRSGRC